MDQVEAVQEYTKLIADALKGTITAPQLEPNDLAAVIAALLEDVDRVARRRGVTLVGDLEPIPICRFDRFQIERAIYLAKANGINAYGFEARDVETQAGLKTRIREIGARVKMWLDVNFLDTRPQRLGDKERLPE